MSSFRTGKFSREDAPKRLRNLVPGEAIESVYELHAEDLAANGIQLVLLDVDNTLLPWRHDEIPQESKDWIAGLAQAGLHICLISNTRNRERLAKIAGELGIEYKVGKFKPSREMFYAALEDHGLTGEQAVMIGDQLFTDILGANRSGIHSILVRPLTKKEFIGTKANRIAEKALWPSLGKVIEEEDDDLPFVKKEGIFERRIVRQIAKFCIVGGSSFLIDAGLHKILMFSDYGGARISTTFGTWLQSLLHPEPPTAWQAYNAAFTVFKILTGGLAILNSFYWNRKWTFGIRGKEDRGQQLAKFVTVSLIGLGLNVVIASGLSRMLPFQERMNWTVATIVAAAVVAIWNFSGQRLWAFRKGAKGVG